MQRYEKIEVRIPSKIESLFFASFIGVSTVSPARSWPILMTEVALRQAVSPDASWDPGQRDCAGFIRYIYHSVFGNKKPLWKDKSGIMKNFLRAEELIGYNFRSISKVDSSRNGYSHLKTGDVLVYYNPDKNLYDSWHLMLILFPNESYRNQPLIVYHNGARDASQAIRKIWWESLFIQGWQEWRPDIENSRFKGIYRWTGLADQSQIN